MAGGPYPSREGPTPHGGGGVSHPSGGGLYPSGGPHTPWRGSHAHLGFLHLIRGGLAPRGEVHTLLGVPIPYGGAPVPLWGSPHLIGRGFTAHGEGPYPMEGVPYPIGKGPIPLWGGSHTPLGVPYPSRSAPLSPPRLGHPHPYEAAQSALQGTALPIQSIFCIPPLISIPSPGVGCVQLGGGGGGGGLHGFYFPFGAVLGRGEGGGVHLTV